MNTDRAAVAAHLARAGIPVIPLHAIRTGGHRSLPAAPCTCRNPDCASPGKHPRTRRGVTDATCDLDVVGGWWDTWPNSNVGVATGSRSRLLVVDLDGPDGTAAFGDLIAARGFPSTLGVTTGRGIHWWLRLAPGVTVPNTAGKLGDGIDTRGDGGYVLAPPSIHYTGVRYEWITGRRRPLASAPEWLLSLLLKPAEGQHLTRDAGDGVTVDDSRASRYLAKVVQGTVAKVAAESHTRNTRLFNAARLLAGYAAGANGHLIDTDACKAALLAAALESSANGDHPVTEREAVATIRSGWRCGETKPLSVPERRSVA